MNCIQAQVLLTAHRELKNSDVDLAELDEHLEQCSSCRQVLARSHFIGEQVRSLPTLEPSSLFHAKLMEALATEHSQFILHSTSPVPPPPDFLKPYLREYARSAPVTDPLAAFSTADTGPLPIIRVPHTRRSRPRVGRFAIAGLAAVFVLTLMMGGITSLLLLAQNRVPASSGSTSMGHLSDLFGIPYTTNTSYPHVVSAIADSSSIYYSAYSSGSNSSWMIERLNRSTKISTPLLASPVNNPLIILGSANGWLLWLQFNTPTPPKNQLQARHPLRTWNLHSLSLTSQPSTTLPISQNGAATPTFNQPVTLLSNTFDQDTVPTWIHSPVQGIWFIQNTLLVALVDTTGLSHLMSYPLSSTSGLSAREIASDSTIGHIITSPTSSSDGSQIYWADEWQASNGIFHSNIWLQQTQTTFTPIHGQKVAHTVRTVQAFINDDMSFHPTVVDDTLFYLSTAPASILTQTTPPSSPTRSTQPVATPFTNALTVPWADSNMYIPPLDSSIRGTLLMYPSDTSVQTSPTVISGIGSASSIQAGTDFILWQNNNSYGMYDVPSKSDITVGDALSGAQFLAVNSNTAVWTTDIGSNVSNSSTVATLIAFNWPR